MSGRNNSYAFHQSLPVYSGLSDRPKVVLTVFKMTTRKSYSKHISYRDSAHLFLKIQQQIKNVPSKKKNCTVLWHVLGSFKQAHSFGKNIIETRSCMAYFWIFKKTMIKRSYLEKIHFGNFTHLVMIKPVSNFFSDSKIIDGIGSRLRRMLV